MSKSQSPATRRQTILVNIISLSQVRPALKLLAAVVALLIAGFLTPARAQSTVTLEGQVLGDWFVPVQGALVIMTGYSGGGPSPCAPEITYYNQTTVTDAGGFYRFTLPAWTRCVELQFMPYMYGRTGTGAGHSAGVATDMSGINLRLNSGDKLDNAGAQSCGTNGRPGDTGASKPVSGEVGQPVNVTNGNMYIRQTDYTLPGAGAGLQISRSYNSVSTRVGLFGTGWSTLYDEAITVSDDNLIRLYEPDGRATYFSRSGGVGAFLPATADVRAQIVRNADNSYTLTFKDGSIHKFNAAGKLLWLKDRNDNQTTLTYDASGKLTAITDPFGRALTVVPNANGQVQSISDAMGTIATYGYTGSRLDSVLYADNSRFNFHYEWKNNREVIVNVKDAFNHVVEAHEYDSYGRATTSERHGGVEKYTLEYLSNGETQVTDARGKLTKYFFRENGGRGVITRVEGICGCGSGGQQTQSMTYDNQLNVLTKTNALNQTTTYTYDPQGNRLTSTDVLGTTTYTYNGFGQVLTATDPMNGVTTLTYDTRGNLETITNALNKTTTLTNNTRGQVKTITDARGKVTSLDYDPATGDLIKVTDAEGEETEYEYDDRARLTKVTDALSHETTYEYDDPNRKLTITRADDSVVEVKYDVARRRERITDARGHETEFEYDAANRLKKVTDAADKETQYGYDLMSNLQSRTDALGRVTDYEYDDFNRLKKIIYPPATTGAVRLTELFEYYPDGQIKKQTDTAGRVTEYEYDTTQRLWKVKDALSHVTEYKYNNRSHLTEVIDAKGQHYVFTPDAVGRVTQMTRGGDSMSMGYDDVGNRISRTDYEGQTTTYLYDDLNRLERITYPNSSTAVYGYDELSRLKTATNQHGTVTFTYDAMNRVESTTDVFGQVITYSYDLNGNRKTLNRDHQSVTYEYDELNRLREITDTSVGLATYTYTDIGQVETRTLPNGVTTHYEYNGLSQLKQLQERRGTVPFLTREYGYNTAGQINQVTETESGQGVATHAYGYDDANRLTSATHSNQAAESYSYDAVGNRTASHTSSSYQYEGFNQLISTASQWAYTYDDNGNQLSKLDGGGHYDEWRYTWNFENRLTNVQVPSGESITYKYDALGRRIERTSGVSGLTTQYTYDGQEVVLDTNSDSSTVEYLNGVSVDEKLVVNHSSAGVFYLLHDQLGSTRLVTDAGGGVVDHVESDSFGNSVGSSLTRYTFTGREWDEEAGLYYYRARWYDSQQGRFISEDPIGLDGGINLYAYVKNNPVKWKDPFGLYEPESDGYPRPIRPYNRSRMPQIDSGVNYFDLIFFEGFSDLIYGDGGLIRREVFEEFLFERIRSQQPCKPFGERVWQSFSETNQFLPGMGAPSIIPGLGVGAITGGKLAEIAGEPTFMKWQANWFGPMNGVPSRQILKGTAIRAGLNAIAVGGAYETGVYIGSIIDAATCPCGQDSGKQLGGFRPVSIRFGVPNY